ncbi:MAG: archaeal heat shock protein Hsp20 [Candidatus Micrarchaeota archaeon]
MANGKKRVRRTGADRFEGEFFRIQGEMERMVEDVFSLHDRKHPIIRSQRPFVYGFSVKIAEGRPEIREFGNIPPFKPEKVPGGQEFHVSREPLIDVIESRHAITVIAELPGVGKDDIRIDAEEKALVVKAKLRHWNYNREIQLPCAVDPSSAKLHFKNGVLEVRLNRVSEARALNGKS